MGDGDRRAADADAAPQGAATRALASWVLPLGLLLLLGPIGPLSWGLAWPIALAIALMALAYWHWRVVSRWLAAFGGWHRALADAAPGQRAVALGLVVLPAAALLTVAARTIASIVVAYPASIWAFGAVAIGTIVVAFTRGRARMPVTLLAAALVPLSGVWGAGYEADGPAARGWAHSGPIHGIHPFQTTAIVVDGHGPFDLPINDYVEPDGARGYGPESLADALERALHDIAEIHFAEGPHRARMAFAHAEVEHRIDPPIRERLDREPPEAEHPRLVVRSGTWGQRSRVEFVCPGRREDPRGPRPDNVMNRMCPDKYASEGSAGLGVTGRWPGYAEGRGNERLGLSTVFGWTRSDDREGQRIVERETRLWAWLVLALTAAVALFGGQRTVTGLRSTTGAVAALAMLSLVVGALGARAPDVALFERPPAWADPWTVRPWLSVLMLGGALFWFDGDPRPATAGTGRRTGVGTAAVALVVSIMVVAGHLGAVSWIQPRLWADGDGGPLAFEQWIGAVADAVGPRAGLDILKIEGMVAATTLAVLLGTCVALGVAIRSAARWAWPEPSGRGATWAVIGIVLVAAALVLSRKTGGASTLVHGAIGLTLLLGSGLALLARSRTGRGGGGPALRLQMLAHVAWTALAVVCVLASAAAAPVMHPFVVLCAAIGLVVALGGLAFVVPLRSATPREPPPGTEPPTGGA